MLLLQGQKKRSYENMYYCISSESMNKHYVVNPMDQGRNLLGREILQREYCFFAIIHIPQSIIID